MTNPIRVLLMQAFERAPTQAEAFEAMWEIVEKELDEDAQRIRQLRGDLVEDGAERSKQAEQIAAYLRVNGYTFKGAQDAADDIVDLLYPATQKGGE